MGKYDPLGRFLRGQGDEVRLTFEQIERIIGGPLPPKAQQHRAWWSNNAANNVMTRVWREAGFRSEQVDLERRTLVFRRVTPQQPERQREVTIAEPSAVWEVKTVPETTHHPLFGWMKGLIHVPPDTDLTEPAAPEWAELIEQAGR